ncbi:3-dehydroquinate synthase family protein [Streptomyces radiopugnans]|uniref:3-dehydroquinate synthase family protein n=1 Tax=Streptomyces radiopugnans TaxID=403935 RepID=UPI003F1CE4C2
MREGTLRIGSAAVPYRYGADCLDALCEGIEALRPASAILALDEAARAHAEPLLKRLRRRMPVYPFVITPAEEHKRLSLVESLLDHAVANGADRTSVVLGMGGGLVGNVAGLAASLLYRGVRLVHLPTTPVAAFDAVLSLKQGANLGAGKNLCGTYLAPAMICCDLAWLATIPRPGLLTGITEMAKNVLAVVPDWEHAFEEALAQLPERPVDAFDTLFALGLAAKAPLLSADPHERHGALVFEYGHTVGHALESVFAGAMSHGEAVAWGMLVAAEVSAQLGRLDQADVARHYLLLSSLELPPAHTALGSVGREALAARLATDNKRGHIPCSPGSVPMVLLRRLGEPVEGPDGRPLIPVPLDVVFDAFEKVAATEVI